MSKHHQHKQTVEVKRRDEAPGENPIADAIAAIPPAAPAPAEEGPPFYATEYLFKHQCGNVKQVYAPLGAPQPTAPVGFEWLVGIVKKFPFPTQAARDAAIG